MIDEQNLLTLTEVAGETVFIQRVETTKVNQIDKQEEPSVFFQQKRL